MMSLFIDTSNFKLVVGVINEENNTLISYYNEVLNSDLSSKALDVIKNCINNANKKPQDIDKVYIVVGPGSFTGVRIGVTIAKTFGWALNKKVIPISSLEVLASTKVNTEYIVPMIDARRDSVFAGIYDNNLNVVMDDTYISLENLSGKLPDDYTFISDDDFENYTVEKSNINILSVVEKHKNDLGVNPHELVPSYLKITEAEANLKKND